MYASGHEGGVGEKQAGISPATLIETLPFPMAAIDLEGRWAYMNPAAARLMGAGAPDEMLGLRAKTWSGLECGPAEGFRPFLFHSPRLGRYYRGWSSPLIDVAGRAVGRVEAMQDMTDDVERESRQRIIYDLMPLGCDFWDENLNHIDCNNAILAMLGMDDKRRFLQGVMSAVSPQRQPDGRPSAEAAVEYIQQAFDIGRIDFEWTYLAADGSPVPVSVRLRRAEYGDRRVVVGFVRDLRADKARDAGFADAWNLHKNIIDSCPVCFAVIVEGRVRYTTPFTRTVFGVDDGSSAESVFVNPLAWRTVLAAVESGGAYDWTVVPMRAADGTPRDMMLSAFATDFYGQPGIMSWMIDVTNLRQADERMRVMLDATPLAVTFWDENFDCLDCNAAAYLAFGLPDKQALLRGYRLLSPKRQPNGSPSDAAAREHIARAFADGHARFEWMHQKPDGSPIPSEITLVRMPYGERQVVVGFNRDLREIVAQRREADLARERMRALFDAVPLCANFWNREPRNIDCNAAAPVMFGLPDKKTYLEHFAELSPKRQPGGASSVALVRTYIARAFEEGRLVFRWTHQTIDGKPIPCEITLVRTPFGGEDLVIGFTRDLRGSVPRQAASRGVGELFSHSVP